MKILAGIKRMLPKVDYTIINDLTYFIKNKKAHVNVFYKIIKKIYKYLCNLNYIINYILLLKINKS